MRYIFGALVFIFSALFVVWGTTENTGPSSPISERAYVQNDLLVSVDWTKKHLLSDEVIIIDARGDEAYDEGHIQGAISATWKVFSKMKAPMGKGFTTLLDPEELSEKFRELGIDDKKTVVVYANPDDWGEDGRIVWMLRRAGLFNTKILDGGWPAWEKAEGKISKTKTIPTPSNIVIKQMNPDMLATTEWITKNRKDIVLIDTRSLIEWYGATNYGEVRGGHIKDALHLKWSEFFNEDNTIKTQTQIEEIMKKEGITKNDTIVLYCTAGIRSAHMTLILRMAGYKNAKNYAASIYEWAAKSELPMEK